MAPTTLEKFRCWNTDRVPEVIDKQAVSVNIPAFMATHTPFHKITYLRMPVHLDSTSEDDFLTELCRRSGGNLHTFAVIQGIPGSGKSHLIRWLKERYAAQTELKGGHDVILLIERANNTLRQTLYQILDSGVFNEERFANQREKLARTATQLSSAGIEESLINNLQVAYIEDRGKGVPSLRSILERHLYDFLLDSAVREEMRCPGGPIKRIARFLATENMSDTGDVLPVFQPDDFDYDAQFLQKLRNLGARQDTQALVDKLTRPQNRAELASYLNSLLEFAIGRTTALSSDDLKLIFYDLRKELRRQGRGLALFIEDITVFTGLDTGIVDILVTQHTGEGDRSFCRILSVVGITDEYYRSKFPDNIRDRISHLLTLNESQSSVATELLSTRDGVAGLAARYLNAIRLVPDVLQAWYSEGADPAHLPNACSDCTLRMACHAAFGAVPVASSTGDMSAIGLYPFNAEALWTMYENIKTNVALRTPRTLLNAIISYVLLSHSTLIDQGRFPPPRTQVGSEFDAPTLLNPQQRSLLSAYRLSADISDRLESLVVFWGNRTFDATDLSGETRLGSLPQGVFDAFGLPFIAGQPVVIQPPPPVSTEPIPPAPTSSTQTGSQTQKTAEQDPVVLDIEAWRTGKQLQTYNILGQALARFLRDAIDWDSYDIPRSLVDDRVRQSRFFIQGQAGRSVQRYTLTLKRADALVNVFYAVHALEGAKDELTPDQLCQHITALAAWLDKNEAEIIKFVLRPQSDANEAPTLTMVQLQTAAALATLAGELNSETAQSPEQQAKRLIRFCRGAGKWESMVAKAQVQRANGWARLSQNSQIASNVDAIRNGLLESLNCPQGRSRSVIFVDMASLLDAVQGFRKADWMMAALNFAGEGDVWQTALTVYNSISLHFADVLREERSRLQDLLARLDILVAGSTGRELDAAIRRFLKALAISGLPVSNALLEDAMPAFGSMEQTRTVLRNLVAEQSTAFFAPGVSGILAYSERIRGYLDYLDALKKFSEKSYNDWQLKLTSAEDVRARLTQTRTAIEQMYESVNTVLTYLSSLGESR